MSSKEQQIPAIRFNGFTDTWEQRKLGEVSEITKLAGFEFTKYIKYSDAGHVPAIRGLNVKNGNFVFNDVKYIDESDFSKLSRSKLFAGDIVFTYVGTIGEAAIIPENVTWYLAPNVSRIRTTELNPTFLLQLLINPVFRRKEIETWIATSSQPALSMENIRKFEMNIPSHKEQTKIGKFFNNLDKTIALHQRQLDNYREWKKAMLQKMFPKEGEKVPEVRFDGFTEEWEQRELKDILKVNSGRDYKHLGSGDIPVYGTGGYMLSVNEKLSNQDAIGIGRKGTIDKPQYLRAPFWTVDTLFFMIPLNNFDLQFLYSMTQKINWKRMDESTGVPSLSKAVIEKVNQSIPSYQEQIKIGNFFKQLDDTIALHKQKVNDYQQLKNVMLQQMFI